MPRPHNINAQYNVAKPESLPIRIATRQRRKMFATFLKATRISNNDTVLDLGVTSDQSYDHSNYFEAWYPHKQQIIGAGTDNASFLEALYPGLKFVQADGRMLPFDDRAFDFVHSSAVFEHVGGRQQQVLFLSELWRVARKGIFVTTPNRWFPIEFHTTLPLIHWLPATVHREIFTIFNQDFFAEEANLNLTSRRELSRMAALAGIECFRIETVAGGGWPTYVLLVAERPRQSTEA
jgi:ubiquinone/menaquinone biosynthesis C-methylase UbiE